MQFSVINNTSFGRSYSYATDTVSVFLAVSAYLSMSRNKKKILKKIQVSFTSMLYGGKHTRNLRILSPDNIVINRFNTPRLHFIKTFLIKEINE